MAETMSQDEINMLINKYQDNTNGESNNKITSSSSSKKQNLGSTNLYKPIDFRKPNKLQYDNLGALKQIHEQFVKSLNNYLTMLLRISIQAEVDFEIIEQLTYQQYISLANKNCLWGIYSTSNKGDDEGRCFIQFDAAFCDFFIDRTFGGSEEYTPYDDDTEYKMADMTKEMSRALFTNVLNIYEQAWVNSDIMDFNMSLSVIEDNVQNLNLGAMSSEMMLIIPVEISIYQKRVDDDESDIKKSIFKIGIPYGVIEPVLDKLNISNMLLSHRSEVENEEIIQSIQSMSNLVEVYVGKTEIPFLDALNLDVDDIIFLGKKRNDTYDINVGGVKKYEGRPYKIKNSVCIQITDLK